MHRPTHQHTHTHTQKKYHLKYHCDVINPGWLPISQPSPLQSSPLQAFTNHTQAWMMKILQSSFYSSPPSSLPPLPPLPALFSLSFALSLSLPSSSSRTMLEPDTIPVSLEGRADSTPLQPCSARGPESKGTCSPVRHGGGCPFHPALLPSSSGCTGPKLRLHHSLPM